MRYPAPRARKRLRGIARRLFRLQLRDKGVKALHPLPRGGYGRGKVREAVQGAEGSAREA